MEDYCAQIALSVIYLLFKFESIPSTNEGVRVVHALHMLISEFVHPCYGVSRGGAVGRMTSLVV